MMTKICTLCKIEKPVSDFYLLKNKPVSRCKRCSNESKFKYQYEGNIKLYKKPINDNDRRNIIKWYERLETQNQYGNVIDVFKICHYYNILVGEIVNNRSISYMWEYIKIWMKHERNKEQTICK